MIHLNYLERCGFNEEQCRFIAEQRQLFLAHLEKCNEEDIHFDMDGYESDMWYTMNRSGLFEDKQWGVVDTRAFITEWRSYE